MPRLRPYSRAWPRSAYQKAVRTRRTVECWEKGLSKKRFERSKACDLNREARSEHLKLMLLSKTDVVIDHQFFPFFDISNGVEAAIFFETQVRLL